MQRQRRLDEALKHHNNALTLRLDTYGENHFGVAESYNNISEVCILKGEQDKARDYFNKAIAMRLRAQWRRSSQGSRYLHPHCIT